MKRTDLRKILIIGSGPIVIGQGCEFDYSGVQAVKALKSLGYEVVLVNSNPATVMTDPDRADRTYVEPLTADYLHEVIRRERPDAILPTLGGQTALNLAMELDKRGVLKRYRVELIGAKAEAIERAEDRNLFKEAMRDIGLDLPRSGSAHSLAEAEAIARTIGSWPLIVRPGFTLGGTGGGIAHDAEEFARIVSGGLEASLNHEVLVEESLIGWKEYEMEVMRDKAGNAVIVCSIENMDPMGVHTGDSITVAPILTLTDREYQEMRDDSIKVLEKIGIETGGSNVQWAVNPKDGRRIIIEMNPRVSRSSALASKATGFPIAKIAALLAVGFTLDEITNDITGKTLACFEPSLDYVVVKIPRFAFEKFPGANQALGTQMKSVGEVMAIGRTFKQAYLKAVRSLEAPLKYHDAASYDPWFKRELDEIEEYRKFLASQKDVLTGFTRLTGLEENTNPVNPVNPVLQNEQAYLLLLQAKVFGFSDKEIAAAIGSDEIAVRNSRLALGIRPEFGEVDTCAGEFEAVTPYYYSYYGFSTGLTRFAGLTNPTNSSNLVNPVNPVKKKIMVLGGGPNRIGQGIEFDWCCCHAAFSLRKRGYEVVMVNSNPETVSTDYDTSDTLYFEPLTFEDVMEIYDREKCDGVIVQYGGQTPLNLAEKLEKAGAKIVGTSPKDIALAEDRDFFRALVAEIGMKQPASGIAHSIEDARRIAKEIGYPVLVRPSFVLGGRGMAIVYRESELDSYVSEAVAASEGKPILIDKFLEHAIELDVDAVSDGETTMIGAILEHIEAAGCHSGDAAAITPPVNLSDKTLAEVKRYTEIFAKRLNVVGLMNLQLAVKDGEIWMIEVNPRASRTVPFVSKATGIPLADLGALAMVGEKLPVSHSPFPIPHSPNYYCVKEAVFPYVKFPGAKITLSPEMKSTGEVMAIDPDRFGAYYKSQVACGSPLPKSGKVFLSVRDDDKPHVAELAAKLKELGYGICATLGTSTYLWNHGIEARAVFRISRGRPNAIDLIRKGEIQWVVNTSESDGEASGDSVKMRSSAVASGIPVTTTLAGFAAAVAGLAETRVEDAVYSLQEYLRPMRASADAAMS